jgi:predicted nucleic acid-binding protein
VLRSPLKAPAANAYEACAQPHPPIDRAVTDEWALLRLALRDAGRRMPVKDSWIAATAIAYGVPLVTQDDDHVEVGELRASTSE